MILEDKSGRTYHFINQSEKEKRSAKMYYYLWLSRLFVLIATISLMVFLASSLALFKLAPQVYVEPFLIINQNTSEDLVRYEPIAFDMASREKFMELFVRQYVMYRNTIVNDPIEMMSRWHPGGIVNFLSDSKVFNEFRKDSEQIEQDSREKGINQEVEIISAQKVGGRKSAVWKVDFKTYEVSSHKQKEKTGYLTLNVRYWTASITAYFIPSRLFMGRRLLNPLGFTVVKYSQSKVQI